MRKRDFLYLIILNLKIWTRRIAKSVSNNFERHQKWMAPKILYKRAFVRKATRWMCAPSSCWQKCFTKEVPVWPNESSSKFMSKNSFLDNEFRPVFLSLSLSISLARAPTYLNLASCPTRLQTKIECLKQQRRRRRRRRRHEHEECSKPGLFFFVFFYEPHSCGSPQNVRNNTHPHPLRAGLPHPRA